MTAADLVVYGMQFRSNRDLSRVACAPGDATALAPGEGMAPTGAIARR
jgi:hypothetical protein